jgi:hypothetical protein
MQKVEAKNNYQHYEGNIEHMTAKRTRTSFHPEINEPSKANND